MTGKELEQIYNKAYKAVYWTAMQFLRNEADAEDVVQDTFISFMESYADLKDTDKAVALLKKIAANKCLDRIKLSKTDIADEEFFDGVEAIPEDFLPDSIIESEDFADELIDKLIEKFTSEGYAFTSDDTNGDMRVARFNGPGRSYAISRNYLGGIHFVAFDIPLLSE